MKICILLPTYNEAINIAILLPKIAKEFLVNQNHHADIIVIDDSSPDGTGEVVSAFAIKNTTPKINVHLLTRNAKEGLGKAYLAGFKHVLKHIPDANYILQMDSDLSHDPLYIPSFIKQASCGADLVIGSRYIYGGSTPDWTWYRKLLSSFGNLFARAILKGNVSDYTGGFNLISIALLNRLELENLNSSGYGFLIDLKYSLSKKAIKIKEVPIKFLDREYGNSKMPLNTIFKNFILVIKLKFTRN